MRVDVNFDSGDGPALCYLPGIGGTGALARLCLERLAPDFRAVGTCYQPGGGPDSYRELARSVIAALDARGIDRALLLAESFGGGVAMQMALDHPERVGGLALVNTFAKHPSRRALHISNFLAATSNQWIYRAVRRFAGRRGLLGEHATPEVLAVFDAHRAPFGADYRTRLRMLFDFDLRARLPEIQQPVALFAAERDRVVASVACAREMQALFPDATLRILPGAGHLVLPVAAFDWPTWLRALQRRRGC